MDNILLSQTDLHQLQSGLQQLLNNLKILGLQITPEKIQTKAPYAFLGHHISDKVTPTAISYSQTLGSITCPSPSASSGEMEGPP